MSELKPLQLPEEITVRSLAGLMNISPTDLIGKLVANGVMVTINQPIDYDTAALVTEEYGYSAEPLLKQQNTIKKNVSASRTTAQRAPIVTIMGHVDHGKTSLLDFIRRSNVAAGESGGITQHISAYQIDFTTSDNTKRKITFVDTPGHEAFSALRAHGASLTDLVILVVAADDGVKPQTIEAINHAKAANVPIIVAINKIDLPGANLDRVKQQLMEQELVPEEWGGKTVMVGISAKNGTGVNELLDYVILVSDLLELKADPEAAPEGIVLEANLDKQKGPLATVLVYNGTLRAGQVVVVGKTYGRIRSLTDDLDNSVTSIGPAKPAHIAGLKEVPSFGDTLEVVPSEKVARSMTQSGKKTSATAGDEESNSLNIILKADVGGSLAALEESISKLTYKDARVTIVSSGIGQVTENDVTLAKAAKAMVIAFRVSIPRRVVELAEKDAVTAKEFWVIYEILELLQDDLRKIATPVFITTEVGRLKVLEVFSWKSKAGIVGGEVTQGELRPNLNVVIYRDKEEIGKAKSTEIKIGKIATDRVEPGQQCGVSVHESSVDITKGDILAFTETVEEK